MTCRAPTGSTTCSGTPTGQQLTYDNEGRLTQWQNTPSAPTSTDQYLYDGEGNRVEQQVTSSGTTTTVYVGDIEHVATTGGTTTTYYDSAGQRIPRAGVGRRMELLDTTIHRAPLIGLHAPTHACGARTVR
jgi:YD repeat-containing protein